MHPHKSILHQPYGLLTVIALKGRNAHGNSIWLCQCACGNTCEALYQNLTTGRTKSCGCAPRGRKPKMPS